VARILFLCLVFAIVHCTDDDGLDLITPYCEKWHECSHGEMPIADCEDSHSAIWVSTSGTCRDLFRSFLTCYVEADPDCNKFGGICAEESKAFNEGDCRP